MSKKKNKKFKKLKRSIVRDISSPSIQKPDSLELMDEKVDKKVDSQITESAITAPTTNDPYKSDKYNYVAKDIRKILLIILIILLVFIGAYFLETKTEILKNMSNWLYNAFNIQSL